MTKSIYIAGPMTGIPEFNFPAFFAAERFLFDKGWRVFNPAQNDINMGVDVTGTTGDPNQLDNFCLRKALSWDMQRICEADAIYMLKGWEHSKGAQAEHTLATALKLEVIYQESMLTFKHLHDINKTRCQEWHSKKPWSLSDWGVAMAGEAGEVCDVIKKLNRIRDGLNTQRNDEDELMIDLGKELADTLLYIDLLATAADIDLEKAVIDKFNEVSDRFGFKEKL